LYILRHAKAEPLSSGQEDHDRRLMARGVRDAERLGQYLAAQGIRPDHVLCSTAARARETLASLQVPEAKCRIITEKMYLASANEMIGLIAGVPESARSLM